MEVLVPGDLKEGGGQVLRIAVSLASVLKKRVRIIKIRAGRKKGGLAAQHLTGLQLVAEISTAKTEGLSIGSTTVSFHPNFKKSGSCHSNYTADTTTAGSTALLLQIALPCCLSQNDTVRLTLKGGTNADFAPSIDYVLDVLRPNLKCFGIELNCRLIKRGFFPAGGGVVGIEIPPIKKLQPINLTDFGQVTKILLKGYYSSENNFYTTAKMSVNLAEEILRKWLPLEVDVEKRLEEVQGATRGAWGIHFEAFTSSGRILAIERCGELAINKNSYLIGEKVALELWEAVRVKACVDKYMQDQLIIYMALADGFSRLRTEKLTLHTETAIEITKMLCDAKFNIVPDGDAFIVECQGIGWSNEYLK